MKEFALAVGLPLAGIGVTIIWKVLIRPRKRTGNQEYLAVFEVLVATLVLTISIWANDTGNRDPISQTVANILTAVIAIAVFPLMAFLVRRAYDQDEEFTKRDAAIANFYSFVTFLLAYLATHYPEFRSP